MRALIFVFCGLFTQSLFGQFSRDPLLNYVWRQQTGLTSIADHVFKALGDAVKLRQMRAEMHSDVIAAREIFFRQYPNGPRLEEARQAFSQALDAKDGFYVQHLLASQFYPDSPGAVQLLTGGGEVDGGIPAGIRLAYLKWAGEMIGRLRAGQSAASIAEAIKSARDSYVVRRDWEEFRARGLMPPGVEKGLWDRLSVGFKLLEREDKDNPETDPYTLAAQLWEARDKFAQGCAAYLPNLVDKPRANACACVEELFNRRLRPSALIAVYTQFDEATFLFASVSMAGLQDQVAACIR